MKKIFIIIAFIFFLISFTILGYMLVPRKNKDGTVSVKEENKITNNVSYNDKDSQNEITETSQEDKKISYNSTLVINKYFSDCKHTVTTSVEMPSDMINLSEEQLKEKYNTWEVLSFDTKEVSLYKEFEGICNEHYIVSVKNGYIAIYKLDEKDKKSLYEQTDISVRYLPKGDISELTAGIPVQGMEKLNELMENYE